MEFFQPYMERITDLCRQHQVASLYAFGSSVKGGLSAESDVDLLFELKSVDPHEFADNFWALEEKFEALFGRHVDLISRRAMKNKYLIAQVESEKVKLYEA